MPKRARRNLVGLVLVLALAAVAAAVSYHHHERQAARDGALATLRAVAGARAGEIERWTRARQQELRVHASGILRIYVQQALRLPASLAANPTLLAELKNTRETEGYQNVLVASPEGRLLLSADSFEIDLDAEARRTVARVVSSGAAAHGDLFRSSTDGKLVVDDAVPIPDEQGRTVAVLIQRTAPEDDLVPHLHAWPVPGSSIATVLARRDGADVLLLNAKRPGESRTVALRWPASRIDLPAVRAVLGGPAPLDGLDERGVAVLVERVAIPGTPWVVVTSQSADEVYARIGTEVRLTLLVVVLAMLFVGAAGELAHRVRRQTIADRMLAAERQQRAAESSRRDSDALRLSIVENIPQRLFVKDRASIYLVVNRAYATSLGLQPEQMVGRDDFAFFPPELAEKYRADDREVMDTGRPKDLEETYVAEGREFVIHTVKVPIRNDAGDVFAVLGLFEDITERKKADAERHRFEAAARQQHKLESIGTLASGVAHEINNPLNVILNYGQLLVDTADDPAIVRDFAGHIVKESERVATIVRNLLSFARQDREPHRPARIADLVERTTSLLHAQFRKDQVAVTSDVPADLPLVHCRTQQIQQVLMNLLANARDALNQKYPGATGDKTIRIRAARFEKDRDPWVRVSLEDHGPGIPPEVAERIFDPFFTTKPRDQGTGLGLSISYGIIHEHGGELRFETRLGVGTTFHVELPVAGGGSRAHADGAET